MYEFEGRFSKFLRTTRSTFVSHTSWSTTCPWKTTAHPFVLENSRFAISRNLNHCSQGAKSPFWRLLFVCIRIPHPVQTVTSVILRFSQRNTETWTNFRYNESENRHGSRKLQSSKNWRISSDLIFYLRTKTDGLKKNRYNTLNESSSRLREHNEQARKNKRKEKELLRIISSDWPLRKLREENTRTNVMSHGLALKWG